MDFMGVNYDNASAVDIIKAILRPYGLDGLAQGMYDQGKTSGDANVAYLWLREQPQYKAAFPGMELRAKNGYAAISEQQYMDYKTAMKSVMANNGLPKDFYDGEDDFAKFIGQNISPAEVEDRVTKGVLAAKSAPQEVKDALFNFYGIDDGHLAAYYLDPNKSSDLLARQAAAAQIGGAATRGHFQGLTAAEAEKLVGYGTSAEDALNRFGALGMGQELLTAQTGEAMGDMSREQQLQYVAGSPLAEQELARRAQGRKAQFQKGGGYAETQGGVAGLGEAS
jgi:hypothetical protein